MLWSTYLTEPLTKLDPRSPETSLADSNSNSDSNPNPNTNPMSPPRTRTVTISRPFDARHVEGAGVPGTESLIPGRTSSEEALTKSSTNTNSAAAKLKASFIRRSNTFSHADKPRALRPKLSFSIEEIEKPRRSTLGDKDKPLPSLHLHLHHKPKPDTTTPKSNNTTITTTKPSQQTRNPPPLPPRTQSHPPPKRKPAPPASKPTIDLSSLPPSSRPLGFKEIMAVKTHTERMKLYKRTQEYWAFADHGLNEWVDRARVGRMVGVKG